MLAFGSLQHVVVSSATLSPCRDVMVKVLESAMAAAAAPARGGFVRESLTAQYPRLALLLESTFQRLVQDTDVRAGTLARAAPAGIYVARTRPASCQTA